MGLWYCSNQPNAHLLRGPVWYNSVYDIRRLMYSPTFDQSFYFSHSQFHSSSNSQPLIHIFTQKEKREYDQYWVRHDETTCGQPHTGSVCCLIRSSALIGHAKVWGDIHDPASASLDQRWPDSRWPQTSMRLHLRLELSILPSYMGSAVWAYMIILVPLDSKLLFRCWSWYDIRRISPRGIRLESTLGSFASAKTIHDVHLRGQTTSRTRFRPRYGLKLMTVHHRTAPFMRNEVDTSKPNGRLHHIKDETKVSKIIILSTDNDNEISNEESLCCSDLFQETKWAVSYSQLMYPFSYLCSQAERGRYSAVQHSLVTDLVSLPVNWFFFKLIIRDLFLLSIIPRRFVSLWPKIAYCRSLCT